MAWNRQHSEHQLRGPWTTRPRSVDRLCGELIAHLPAGDEPYRVPSRIHPRSAPSQAPAGGPPASGRCVRTGTLRVRRQHAQALIDRGHLTAAEALLRPLERDTAAGDRILPSMTTTHWAHPAGCPRRVALAGVRERARWGSALRCSSAARVIVGRPGVLQSRDKRWSHRPVGPLRPVGELRFRERDTGGPEELRL
jgi:hypothetical protein